MGDTIFSLKFLFARRAKYVRVREPDPAGEVSVRAQGEVVTAKEIVSPQGKVVTAKEIEIFGGELLWKNVEMTATLVEVDDTWVKLLLKNDSYVGFLVKDSIGDLFQYAFASKEKYGRALLRMKEGEKMLLTGEMERINGTYVLLVDSIQR